MIRGLIIAAPRSSSGKTVITLGLLRALRAAGTRVAAAKAGPDYIDPTYLAAAAGALCRNLDPWAMRPATLAAQIDALRREADLALCEGVMGLFDGVGQGGAGSTADLAALTGWPVILVVDAEGQGASIAALVEGFARHRGDVEIAGVILNRVAGERHAAILRDALTRALPAIRCLGAMPRAESLHLPSRHLGLVPAGERADRDAFIAGAAALVARYIDPAAVADLAQPARLPQGATSAMLPPLGRCIAVARDDAFVFAYPAILGSWASAGATLSYFSPLADDAPAADCDAVYLSGGYPELFAARLAGNRRFLGGLRRAAAQRAAIYGECGGYMVLGETLTDAEGQAHAMAGLLPVATSFAARKLHLGYRQIALAADTPLGHNGAAFRGHEFHYASILSEGEGAALFTGADADGRPRGALGRVAGTVMGSFVHLIDRA
ncbi:MAG TPA: cobyrinate a,c-diamide synthase [Stellaceae bacterium]|jgi:cobyrinic acid a,c-diamide synthase|nr:cobyrinate a,c-diamide synthase [Stellaceae bacterium]